MTAYFTTTCGLKVCCLCLAAGSEFLLPVRGFFCLICKVFSGDAICAEEHVTTHTHNEKYKVCIELVHGTGQMFSFFVFLFVLQQQHMREYPLYEQRRNLDRQAGLTSQTSGKKRKHEDEDNKSKDKEDKSRHKKDKREKKKEEDPVQKEEAEEKLSKKEGKIVEEKPSYKKKEDDGHHFSKKEDKSRYTGQEGSKVKYSRRDDDGRARYNKEEEHRYRYRRDEGERPKYEPRADKYQDSRSKHDRDEGKVKTFKKPDSGQSDRKMDARKSEPPPKPYNPPKIFCGPSPAMKAKLRKQNLETGKTTPVTPLFGKFMWKKKENLLATEAEKAAAEFIKDDEAADEECLAKSVAAAKEIAQKLATMQNTPPPWVSNSSNQGKLHPELPAPAGFKRPSTVDKPAALNSSQTTRPAGTDLSPQCDGPVFPVPLATNPDNSIRPQNTTLASSSLEVFAKPVSGPRTSAGPQRLQASVVPPHSKPSVAEASPGSKLLPKVSSVHQTPKTPMFEVNSAPQVSEPAPSQAKPVVSDLKPSPCAVGSAPPEAARPTMVTIVSDVAAPGVPESEQTQTVFIKPPPFITLGDGAPKSEKPKRNLAAAKAQDLFGIFYSSTSLSGSFSITRPAKDDRRDDRSVGKIQPQNLQRQDLATPPPQPAPAVLQPVPDGSEKLRTKTELDIKIASVWSLQSTQDPEPGTSYSKITSQTLQPELHQPVQPEDQNISPDQAQPPHPDSLIIMQKSPSRQDTTQKKTEPEAQPQAGQDDQPSLQPDIGSEPTAASEPKLGSKARGKANSKRRTPPASGPVHQTRSHTRYKTRQQQNQPEQDLMPGDSGSAAEDSELLDTSDPGSDPQLEAAEVQEMEIIPESLGLPPDMSFLDFESRFNFE